MPRELIQDLYQKHLPSFEDAAADENSSHINDVEWGITIHSYRIRKKLRLIVEFEKFNPQKDFPDFKIKSGQAFLQYGGQMLSMRGKTSEMYDLYCRFKNIDYMLNGYKRSWLGWQNNKVWFTAKIKRSQPEDLLDILDTLCPLAEASAKI